MRARLWFFDMPHGVVGAGKDPRCRNALAFVMGPGEPITLGRCLGLLKALLWCELLRLTGFAIVFCQPPPEPAMEDDYDYSIDA